MPRDENLQKHTLNLWQGDYAKLQQYYPDIGASVIIRRIIRRYVEQIEAGADVVAEIDVKL